jgi:ubiquinone/menaquinone biosynthesis C-methylase UbiE
MPDKPQKHVFMDDEGNAWFTRNQIFITDPGKDSIIQALTSMNLAPLRALEIGCANGGRLHMLHDLFGTRGSGIDPSGIAIADGRDRFPELDLKRGTAERLDFDDNAFDMVIFGFCLYLVDPVDHFRCVAEADRVLADNGYLVILDFNEKNPYGNDYVHKPGIRSYKMNFSNYFLASPHYTLLCRLPYMDAADPLLPDRRAAVDVLVKRTEGAFPARPDSR